MNIKNPFKNFYYYKHEKKIQKIALAIAGCGIAANTIAIATYEPSMVQADTEKKKVKIAKPKKTKKKKRSTSKADVKTVAQIKNAELQKKAEEDAKAEQEAKDKLADEKTQKEAAEQSTQTISDGSDASSEELQSSSSSNSTNETATTNSTWTGAKLTASAGTVTGPSGKETYYNLDMSGVVSIMRGIGNTDEYWVRSDGVKMLGNYVMVAADLSIRPRGTLVETSLGTGIVCDTGSFIYSNPTQLDIATNW